MNQIIGKTIEASSLFEFVWFALTVLTLDRVFFGFPLRW